MHPSPHSGLLAEPEGEEQDYVYHTGCRGVIRATDFVGPETVVDPPPAETPGACG